MVVDGVRELSDFSQPLEAFDLPEHRRGVDADRIPEGVAEMGYIGENSNFPVTVPHNPGLRRQETVCRPQA